ncbi:MAG: hypothetical protein ABIJ59_18150 [Pseudomonadota bacterium]
MKSGRILFLLLLSLFFLISACQDDGKKGDYSGVSELISGRNKARYDVAEKPPAKKKSPNKPTIEETRASKTDELASAILYEQEVKIVGSNSGQTLADGVAYINKKGQIVRIKILKE